MQTAGLFLVIFILKKRHSIGDKVTPEDVEELTQDEFKEGDYLLEIRLMTESPDGEPFFYAITNPKKNQFTKNYERRPDDDPRDKATRSN